VKTVVKDPLAEAAGARPSHLAVCAECAYAELSAEQPRARCVCAESACAGQIVFAGQPACASLTPREVDDSTLAWCAPGLKKAHARIAEPRPRVR